MLNGHIGVRTISELALFWDFDGTLIYGEETFLGALSSVLQKNNYQIPNEAIRETLKKGCTWNTPEVSYIEAVGTKWWECLFSHFYALYKKFGVLYEKHNEINLEFKKTILDPATYTVYNDALAVLKKCGEMGFDNYVLSNNFLELSVISEQLGIGAYIKEYIVSSNVGYEKPRAEIFEYARRAANYPEVCYMIGDNPMADIEGGSSAGMTTVLVHAPGDYTADYRCDTLSEIPDILKRRA